MGHELKDELEFLAFKELNEDAFKTVTSRLDVLVREGSNTIKYIENELLKKCHEGGIEVEISGRAKSPFCMAENAAKKCKYRATLRYRCLRLLVENRMDCYKLLGLLHTSYPVLPGRFKDYISTPKPNGYQSLHTGIIGPKRQRIEIQIRTHSMQRDSGIRSGGSLELQTWEINYNRREAISLA